jgi:hypothetical protein
MASSSLRVSWDSQIVVETLVRNGFCAWWKVALAYMIRGLRQLPFENGTGAIRPRRLGGSTRQWRDRNSSAAALYAGALSLCMAWDAAPAGISRRSACRRR